MVTPQLYHLFQWTSGPQTRGTQGGTNPHTKYFYTQPGTETRRMLLLYRQSRMGCQGVIHIMYMPPAGVTLVTCL
jgi:hypothetical protein